MNVGKIVFAQIMQFIPRRDFNDIVAKYRGNYRVRNLTCHDQLLVMCLAQYADKNSLRDIEASLRWMSLSACRQDGNTLIVLSHLVKVMISSFSIIVIV